MEQRIRRLRDFDYRGPHRYSLTICTFQSAPILTSSDLVACVSTHFLQAARTFQYGVVVYTVMPDHFHALVDGANAIDSLPVFMKLAKQMSGFHGKRIAGRRIWQKGYFDDVLKPTDNEREYARYIVMNPVDAGFVTDPCEYPFTGSAVHSGDELREYIRRVCHNE